MKRRDFLYSLLSPFLFVVPLKKTANPSLDITGPTDWWTLAHIYKIHDFGKPPEGKNNLIERWVEKTRRK